ncbi:hypothetical protein A8C56_12200 [Niabella ginsenosidivorans]|uniref:Uncharacterized protein n=1 Tax=Niabella ginsenosidivorans TaxID=1176587 RepID=A0A1A9I4N9_9BACT|nr:hypothetical protein A8C56_12200 [Niabella ginsenosidivorans]
MSFRQTHPPAAVSLYNCAEIGFFLQSFSCNPQKYLQALNNSGTKHCAEDIFMYLRRIKASPEYY